MRPGLSPIKSKLNEKTPSLPNQQLQPLHGHDRNVEPLRGSLKRDAAGGFAEQVAAETQQQTWSDSPPTSPPRKYSRAVLSKNEVPSTAPPQTAKTTASQWEPPSDGTAYIGLAYALRQYPNSTEFVYLRRLDKDPTSYNPYALDVVPFTAVEPNDFYTMSVRGVTHYINGITADFTNLDQWEREYQLFNAMCTLTVFNKYKAWKGFRLWRKAVRQGKISRVQRLLKKNLFLLNPIFQQSLMHIRQLCFGVSIARLQNLEKKRNYSLTSLSPSRRSSASRWWRSCPTSPSQRWCR